jgi:hypothetical protein
VSDLAAAVKARVLSLEERIVASSSRSGRRRQDVVLVGACKRQPLAAVRAAVEAGVRHLGENLVQEGEAKRRELGGGIVWHLIGPLQSNKAGRTVETFDVVQSVDRLKIARVLDREAARRERLLPVLVEINLGGETSKHGFAPADLPNGIAPLAELEHLDVRGLMAIPPPTADAEGSRRWHRMLRELRDRLARSWPRPFAGELSMGMSDDFEVAIEEGATYVRVGTELFGPRPT